MLNQIDVRHGAWNRRNPWRSHAMACVFLALANCFGVASAHAQTVETKSWQDISSPGSGVGGVFFVGDSKQRSVVKFVDESPNRVLIAEAILGMVNVPTPQTITFGKESKEFGSVVNKVTELKDKSGVDRVKTVYDATVPSASVVQIQTLIVGAGGSESVQGVLNGMTEYIGPPVDSKNPKGPKVPVKTTELLGRNPQFTDRLVAVNSLLKALSDPAQMETLGRLSIADAYLGNEDRLQKPTLNLNNLMINPEGKFVAIDNFADAPDIQSLAWEIKADQLSNSAEQFSSKKSKKEEKIELTKRDWFEKVILGYRMSSGIRTANLDTAMSHQAESQRIAGVFKDLTWKLLAELSDINTALMPTKSGGSKSAGGITTIKKDDAVWKLTIVSKISESKSSDAGAHLSTSDYKLDWNAAQNALAKGMNDATNLIIAGSGVTKAKVSNYGVDTFLKGAIGAQFQKSRASAQGELDAETLLIRSKFMFLRSVEKKTKDQIDLPSLLKDVDVKKEYKVTLWCTGTERGLIITKK